MRLSGYWGLPLGPPLCHPSSFSRAAVAREDPGATVPVPQGLAWSAPPQGSARVRAQTPPIPVDHAPSGFNPLLAPQTLAPFRPQKGPKHFPCVPLCSGLQSLCNLSAVSTRKACGELQRGAPKQARANTHAHTHTHRLRVVCIIPSLSPDHPHFGFNVILRSF